MPKSIISEGKTTAEAVEKGLAVLRVSKDKVEIRVLESEDKRSFFSILAPRIVKVELTLKENGEKAKIEKETRSAVHEPRKEQRVERNAIKINSQDEDVKLVVKKTDEFLTEFLGRLKENDAKHTVEVKENYVYVNIIGDKLNYLIGYRGETLNAVQIILSSIASKYSNEKIRILLDIENYRAKREKALEDLAEKIARTVMKTKKSITLEPMTSYERKIIHSKLQESEKVKTYSTGVEPYRKVVVALR